VIFIFLATKLIRRFCILLEQIINSVKIYLVIAMEETVDTPKYCPPTYTYPVDKKVAATVDAVKAPSTTEASTKASTTEESK